MTDGVGSSSALPWRLAHLRRLCIGLVASMLAIALAYWHGSRTASLSDQIVWLNVGVAGVITAGVATILWLVVARRAIGERYRVLLSLLGGTTDAVLVHPVTTQVFVTAARMTRFHRSDCPLVAGKPCRSAPRSSHVSAGLEPCGVCQPSDPCRPS